MSALDPLPTEFGYWSTENLSASYDSYTLFIEYDGETGAYQQRVSGPTQPLTKYSTGAGSSITPCENVQLESPSMIVTVHWEARRLNALPSVPNMWPPPGAPFTLLRWKLYGINPKLQSDGQQYAFAVGGRYVYSVAYPILPADGYQLGASREQTLPTSVMVIGVNQFYDTIFNLQNISG